MTLRSSREREKGSVVLVALCFLAVLGLALASYLAVSHQAVKLSNREYQRSISLQLAESGIEQSLWSFNWNNWSAWDTSLIPRSAIRHIFFPPDKYNNGVVGSIMLRVDRYDATVWNNFTTYTAATHDLVWYQGVWYQCITDDIENPPTDGPSAKWRAAPALWNASANYQAGNIVLYGGSAYVCISPNINTLPTDTAKWSSPTAVGNWNGALNYAADNVVLFGGMSYRCVVANSNKSPPGASYWVGSPAIYAEGIATPPDNPAGAVKTQLLALVAPAPLFPNAIGATTTVSLKSSSSIGIVDSYNSLLMPSYTGSIPNPDLTTGFSATIAGAFDGGTAVSISGGTVQGFIAAPSTNSSPYPLHASLAGTLKGTSAGTGIDSTQLLRNPYIPQFGISVWDANRGYRPNDIVFYGSDHYVCTATPTSHQNPSSDSSHWRPNEVLTLSDVNALLELPSSLQASSPPQATSIYVVRESPFNLTHTITIKGSVALFIEGDLQISAGGNIDIPPTSDYPYARAQIQFTGRLRVHSSAMIQNETLDPKKLILIGTASSTPSDHMFNSNSASGFHGTIYMPFATGTLAIPSPFSSANPKFFGAVSAQKVTFNSATDFHYDTSLRTTTFPGIDTPFTVTEWRELTDPAEKIVLP